MVHAKLFRLSSRGIKNAEALAVVAHIEMPFAVIRHAVDSPSVERKALGAGSRGGIVAVERVLAAYPIIAFAVAVDAVGTRGRSGCRRNLSICIKLVDAAFLHGAPKSSTLTLCQTGQAAAQLEVLRRELPCSESVLALIELEQPFSEATHPQVMVLVLKDIVDICGRKVIFPAFTLHTMQRIATLWDNEQTAS